MIVLEFAKDSILSLTLKLRVAFKSHLPSPTLASQIHPDVPLTAKLSTICSPAPHKPTQTCFLPFPPVLLLATPSSLVSQAQNPEVNFGFSLVLAQAPGDLYTIPFLFRGSDSNILGSPGK